MSNFMAEKADHVVKVPLTLSTAREVSIHLISNLLTLARIDDNGVSIWLKDWRMPYFTDVHR